MPLHHETLLHSTKKTKKTKLGAQTRIDTGSFPNGKRDERNESTTKKLGTDEAHFVDGTKKVWDDLVAEEGTTPECRALRRRQGQVRQPRPSSRARTGRPDPSRSRRRARSVPQLGRTTPPSCSEPRRSSATAKVVAALIRARHELAGDQRRTSSGSEPRSLDEALRDPTFVPPRAVRDADRGQFVMRGRMLRAAPRRRARDRGLGVTTFIAPLVGEGGIRAGIVDARTWIVPAHRFEQLGSCRIVPDQSGVAYCSTRCRPLARRRRSPWAQFVSRVERPLARSPSSPPRSVSPPTTLACRSLRTSWPRRRRSTCTSAARGGP